LSHIIVDSIYRFHLYKQHHPSTSHEGVWHSDCIAPLILNLRTRYVTVISLTPQPLHPLNSRQGGLPRRKRTFEKTSIFCTDRVSIRNSSEASRQDSYYTHCTCSTFTACLLSLRTQLFTQYYSETPCHAPCRSTCTGNTQNVLSVVNSGRYKLISQVLVTLQILRHRHLKFGHIECQTALKNGCVVYMIFLLSSYTKHTWAIYMG